MNPRTIVENVNALIRERFLHPETKTVYDEVGDFTTYAPLWKNGLPTREEIADDIPNQCGWVTGMEDCALNGGIYLAGLVDRHLVTEAPDHAQEARDIFTGLRLLSRAGHKPGFVCRGVLPDGKTHYRNSSVDQYTNFVYGMWRYFHSPIATNAEQREITDIFTAIATMLVNERFDIWTDDDREAWVCDLSVVRGDRSSRLLQMLLAAWDVSGEDRWRDLYLQKAMENNQARLKSIASAPDDYGWNPYGLLQSQVSLKLLYDVEPDPTIRHFYRDDLNRIAGAMRRAATWHREFSPELIRFDGREDLNWRYLFANLDSPLHDPRNFPKNAISAINLRGEELTCDNRTFGARYRGDRHDFTQVIAFILSHAGQRHPFQHHEYRVFREPAEALYCVMLSDSQELKSWAAEELTAMFRSVDFAVCRYAASLCYIGATYYLGIRNS